MKAPELFSSIIMLAAIALMALTAIDPMKTMLVTLAFVSWCGVVGVAFSWLEIRAERRRSER